MDNSMQPMIDFPTSALMTSKDSSILSYSRGVGRSGHRGCGGRRFTKRGRGSGSQTYRPHQNNQFTRPCSQICNRIGHTTLDCYHRMDYSFQGKNPPEKLVVMATSYNPVGEQTWFVDSGATNHITNDLRNLSIHLGYQGTDKVSIGILNSGSSVILTPSCLNLIMFYMCLKYPLTFCLSISLQRTINVSLTWIPLCFKFKIEHRGRSFSEGGVAMDCILSLAQQLFFSFIWSLNIHQCESFCNHLAQMVGTSIFLCVSKHHLQY